MWEDKFVEELVFNFNIILLKIYFKQVGMKPFMLVYMKTKENIFVF